MARGKEFADRWTEQALECYESKQDCEHCAVKKIYNIEDCKMPDAIRELIRKFGVKQDYDKMGVKKCSVCGELLPFSQFWRSKTVKGGLNAYCVECGKKLNKKYSEMRKLKFKNSTNG